MFFCAYNHFKSWFLHFLIHSYFLNIPLSTLLLNISKFRFLRYENVLQLVLQLLHNCRGGIPLKRCTRQLVKQSWNRAIKKPICHTKKVYKSPLGFNKCAHAKLLLLLLLFLLLLLLLQVFLLFWRLSCCHKNIYKSHYEQTRISCHWARARISDFHSVRTLRMRKEWSREWERGGSMLFLVSLLLLLP